MGPRIVPLVDFHQLPGTTPHIETVLRPGELITAIAISPSAAAANSRYRKVRDRSSYAFALVSVAAGLDVADGRIRDVRIALGGIAAKPWRACRPKTSCAARRRPGRTSCGPIDVELAAAKPTEANAFKIELAKRTMAAVLGDLTGAGA
jgi:xanthine dehydrogenase YagS FAD-binding subunit